MSISTDGQGRLAILNAAATRVTGTPEQAALQMRAAVRVADGQHPPFTVWPEGLSHEEKSSWLAEESKRESERGERFNRNLAMAQGEAQSA